MTTYHCDRCGAQMNEPPLRKHLFVDARVAFAEPAHLDHSPEPVTVEITIDRPRLDDYPDLCRSCVRQIVDAALRVGGSLVRVPEAATDRTEDRGAA